MPKLIATFCLVLITSISFAQKKGGAQSEAAKERARIKAKYAPFSTCPIKDLKKDTMAMDSILAWKSFYDTIGIKIDLKNLQNYVAADSTRSTLILVTHEVGSPEATYGWYEKVVNKNKKKVFNKKEIKVKSSDIISSQRSLKEPIGLYMVWIEGNDEVDSLTNGELPDTSKPSITYNEYLVWQLYNFWSRGEFADSRTYTICSDICKYGKSEDPAYVMSSCQNGIPKASILDPVSAAGNLTGSGPRSVKAYEPKLKKK